MGNEFSFDDDELSRILNKYGSSSSSEPKTEYKPEPKPEVKPEPKPEVKSEPVRETGRFSGTTSDFSGSSRRGFEDVTRPTLKKSNPNPVRFDDYEEIGDSMFGTIQQRPEEKIGLKDGSSNKIRVNKTAVRANKFKTNQSTPAYKPSNTSSKETKSKTGLFNKDKSRVDKSKEDRFKDFESKADKQDDGFTSVSEVNAPVSEEHIRKTTEHVMSRGEIMKHKTTKQERVKAEMARKKYRRVNNVLNVLLVLFILVFLGSGGYLIRYYMKVRKAESGFTSLRSSLPDSETAIQEIENEFPAEQIVIDEDTGLHYVDFNGVQVQTKFVHLYKQNDHFIGWLNIPDTVIDYPVMYTPFDEEYYLHKDYNKEYSASGTLFVAAKDDPIKPSDNVIIYGHNMKAGTMFHGLLEYESEDFYKNHKTFTFDTIEGNYEYEVIAAFRTKISENDFKYYAYIDFKDEAEFNNYVAQVKMLTPYIIEESAIYGEKLLTLSTCAYHDNEGRFVVVAKRIDNTAESGETSESEE